MIICPEPINYWLQNITQEVQKHHGQHQKDLESGIHGQIPDNKDPGQHDGNKESALVQEISNVVPVFLHKIIAFGGQGKRNQSQHCEHFDGRGDKLVEEVVERKIQKFYIYIKFGTYSKTG